MSMVLSQKQMLQLLANHQKMSISNLEKELGVSKKTLRMMNDYFAVTYGDVFFIKEADGDLLIDIFDGPAFEKLLMHDMLGSEGFNSFHKRQAYLLYQLVYQEKFVSAEDLAEELQISRRTLSRDLIKMEKLLANYALTLETKRGVGIRVVGEEMNIRLLLLYEVLDFYDPTGELPISISLFVGRMIEAHSLPKRIEQLIRKSIKLVISRTMRPLEASSLNLLYDAFDADEYVAGVKQAVETYLNQPLSQAESYFLTFGLNLGFASKEVKNDRLIEKAVASLEGIKNEFNLSFDPSETAVILNSHLTYMVNRSVMKYVEKDLVLRKDLTKSSFAWTMTKYFIKAFKEALEIQIHEHEIQILSTWFEFLIIRSKHHDTHKVLAITNGGYSFRELLKQEIGRFFGTSPQIEFSNVQSDESEARLSQVYDLIFTDHWLPRHEQLSNFFPLSMITRGNPLDKKQMEMSVLSKKMDLLCQLFTVDLTGKGDRYEHHLVQVIEALDQQGLMDLQAKNKLLTKESHHLSILESGLAFPHITMKGTHHIVLGVATCDDISLVCEQGTCINDFIFIGVPELLNADQEGLLIQIFDQVFMPSEANSVKERLGLLDLPGKRELICQI